MDLKNLNQRFSRTLVEKEFAEFRKHLDKQSIYLRMVTDLEPVANASFSAVICSSIVAIKVSLFYLLPTQELKTHLLYLGQL